MSHYRWSVCEESTDTENIPLARGMSSGTCSPMKPSPSIRIDLMLRMVDLERIEESAQPICAVEVAESACTYLYAVYAHSTDAHTMVVSTEITYTTADALKVVDGGNIV